MNKTLKKLVKLFSIYLSKQKIYFNILNQDLTKSTYLFWKLKCLVKK